MKCPLIHPSSTGLRLQQLMDSHGVSVVQLQKFLGLACPQTVYRWLSGKALPTIDHLYSISRYFHVTIDELLIGDAEEDAKPVP